MKIVNILIDKSKVVDYTIFPIRKNITNLMLMGYQINFYHAITAKLLSCDILILISKPFLKLIGETESVVTESGRTIQFLIDSRKYANKIIWLDNSDSTSVTHFEILPYVDRYLKKQIFIDRSIYKKNLIGGRIFTDFYNSNYDIQDTSEFSQFYPLDDKLSYKLKLSWNIGLGKMDNAFSIFNHLRRSAPILFSYNYHVNFHSCKKHKTRDLFLKTSTNLSRELVAFHREELVSKLTKIISKHKLSAVLQGKRLSKNQYNAFLLESKILPSPFGWGELGVRDYEAFINGSLLLKPDMTHMETWPNIFIPEQTYQPFSWDFSNLESNILKLLENKKERIRIAQNGQDAYRDSISISGMEKFCDYFINAIEV